MIETIVTSSVLIAAVIALRLALKSRIKPTVRYALWLIVAVRLLLPFSFFESPVSVMNFVDVGKTAAAPLPADKSDEPYIPPVTVQNAEPAFTAPVDEILPQVTSPADIYTPSVTAPAASVFPPKVYVEPTAPEAHTEASAKLKLDPKAIAKTVWLGAAAAMLLWFGWVNFSFSRKLRRGRRELISDNPAVKSSPIKVYVCGGIKSPLLFGLIKPAVYVTEEAAENSSALEFVIAHELCHYRHLDSLWAALRCVLLSVYWFNPLVWAAACLSKKDCECACDESAIRILGENKRFDYGRTLISMVPEKRGSIQLGVASTSMFGSKKALKERISLIASAPKNTVLAVLITAVVLVCAVGCTFTSAKDKPDVSEDDPIAENDNHSPDSPEELSPETPANAPVGIGLQTQLLGTLPSISSNTYPQTTPENFGMKTFILPLRLTDRTVDYIVYIDKATNGVAGGAPNDDYAYFIGANENIHYIADITGNQIYAFDITNTFSDTILPEDVELYFLDNNTMFDAADKPVISEPTLTEDGKTMWFKVLFYPYAPPTAAETTIYELNLETGEGCFTTFNTSDALHYRFNDGRYILAEMLSDGRYRYYIADKNGEISEIGTLPLLNSGIYGERFFAYLNADGNDSELVVYDLGTLEKHVYSAGKLTLHTSAETAGDLLCLTLSPDRNDSKTPPELWAIDLRDFSLKTCRFPGTDRIGISLICNGEVYAVVHGGGSHPCYSIDTKIINANPPYRADLYCEYLCRSVHGYNNRYVDAAYSIKPALSVIGLASVRGWIQEFYTAANLDMPPISLIVKDYHIKREAIEAYNNLLPDDSPDKLTEEMIDSLYSDDGERLIKAFMRKDSLYYQNGLYSLSTVAHHLANLSGGLACPSEVLKDYADGIRQSVGEEYGEEGLLLLEKIDKRADELKLEEDFSSLKVGDAVYSFEQVWSDDGESKKIFRVDIVLTEKDSSSNFRSLCGNFELRVYDMKDNLCSVLPLGNKCSFKPKYYGDYNSGVADHTFVLESSPNLPFIITETGRMFAMRSISGATYLYSITEDGVIYSYSYSHNTLCHTAYGIGLYNWGDKLILNYCNSFGSQSADVRYLLSYSAAQGITASYTFYSVDETTRTVTKILTIEGVDSGTSYIEALKEYDPNINPVSYYPAPPIIKYVSDGMGFVYFHNLNAEGKVELARITLAGSNYNHWHSVGNMQVIGSPSFEAFGLSYDENGALYYNGTRVSKYVYVLNFGDTKKSPLDSSQSSLLPINSYSDTDNELNVVITCNPFDAQLYSISFPSSILDIP